ncbi:MMPL family transporter [Actinoplanes sp. NPDC049802]|uniref:MMPL family transporter n=1 Tax=Actinoplanes sp. NPDC049802 TaxID=3154742 RepID=UPI0033FEC3A7
MRMTSSARTRVWLWAVLVGWLTAVVVLWPAAQRMGEGETDRASVELASGKDSTVVREVLDAAGDDHDESVVLLLTRPGGLTAADREWFGAVRRDLAGRPYVLGEPAESADGAAILLPMTFHDPEDMVAGVRAAAVRPPAGATAQVTGPAAIEVDADDIEAGTDGRLLAATALVVVALLLLTYRSPVLWLLPLLSVGAALVLSQALITGFAELGGEYSGLTGKILTVLVFGVGTDYALLLVARYREELTRHAAPHRAMREALRRTAGTVTAAAATVIGGVLCLMLASVPETRALGPTLALAVAATAVVMLTLLPALLVCCGRWIFWPRIPRPDAVSASARLWERVASAVAARPVRAMLISALLLLSLGQGIGALQWGLDPVQQFRTPPESVAGLRTAGEHFPADGVDPLVMIAPPADAARAREILAAQPGVRAVEATTHQSGYLIHEVRVDAPPFTRTARDAVADLRAALSAAGSPALLGGAAAETLDSGDAARRDLLAVGPAILAVIALVLLAMLRSVRLTAGLLGAVLLTALSAAGITVAAGRYVFDFAGLDARIPLFALVFVIAVGVDYSIFLLQRYREEKREHDPVTAMRRATAATGGVVTSAGVVLAATFLVLTTLPLVALTQLGLAVAAGILLDTFVVRTVLMPALVIRMDRPAVAPVVDRPLAPIG